MIDRISLKVKFFFQDSAEKKGEMVDGEGEGTSDVSFYLL